MRGEEGEGGRGEGRGQKWEFWTNVLLDCPLVSGFSHITKHHLYIALRIMHNYIVNSIADSF